MKTVLLTGSQGYIGNNFYQKYENIYNFVLLDKKIGRPVQDYMNFDVDEIDYIIHLAAISGIANCEENPDMTFIDNVSTTLHLMMASWAFNIPMIFASSQCAKNPGSSLYATTKRIGEVEAMRYNNKSGNIKCLRFSNIYGGLLYLEKKTSAVSKFMKAKSKNESLIIHGDGSQTRDFIHVDEVCKAIETCLSDEKIKYPVDVGTGIARSVKEVANMISDNIIYEKERDVGSSSSIANIEDIKKLTGFVAKDKLKEYIDG
jgi:UDP-glucose 4-epimerase